MIALMMLKQALSAFFTIYSLMILGRILSSWFPQAQGNPIVQFLSRITDPYLNLFRRLIPRIGMIDISPMVAMFSLYGIESLIFWLIP